MSRGLPRFFDLPGDDASAGRWTGKPRSAPPDADRAIRHDRPDPFEPPPDTIDAGWTSDRPQAARRGTSVLALTGIAILLAGWLLVSLVGSILDAYHASPAFGGLAFCIYAIGLSLITLAGLSEWQAWRSLRRVDDLRADLAQASASLAEVKRTIIAWLANVPDCIHPTGAIITAVRGAESHEHIGALVRDSLAEPFRQEIARIARRSAVTGGMLVALSPHAAWDGMIIAVWSLKIIRRIAELHGLRPGPVVTLLLFRRIARTAVEIAAVDLVAQNVAAKLLEHTPLLRHVAASIPGMGVAELRLYRFAILAGRACSPFED